MDESTAPVLTAAQRKTLKASAHHLKPVVMVGDAGLTDAVLAEADRALAVHGLIKVRVFGDEREARAAMMAQLCAALDCAPVQAIGKLLVLYRPRPDLDMTATGASARKIRKPSEPHFPKKAAGARTEVGKPARPPAKRKSAPRRAAAASTAPAPGTRPGTGSAKGARTFSGVGAGPKSGSDPRRGAATVATKRSGTGIGILKGVGTKTTGSTRSRSETKTAVGARSRSETKTSGTARSGAGTQPARGARSGPATKSAAGGRTAGSRSAPAPAPRPRRAAAGTATKGTAPRSRGRKGS